MTVKIKIKKLKCEFSNFAYKTSQSYLHIMCSISSLVRIEVFLLLAIESRFFSKISEYFCLKNLSILQITLHMEFQDLLIREAFINTEVGIPRIQKDLRYLWSRIEKRNIFKCQGMIVLSNNKKSRHLKFL